MKNEIILMGKIDDLKLIDFSDENGSFKVEMNENVTIFLKYEVKFKIRNLLFNSFLFFLDSRKILMFLKRWNIYTNKKIKSQMN